MSGAYFMLQFLKKDRIKKQQKLLNQKHQNSLNSNISKCRICLKNGNIQIFNSESSFDIKEAISTFGGVEVSENDEYPKHLCTICHTFLHNAVTFRKSAQQTDNYLRENLTQKSEEEIDTVEDSDFCIHVKKLYDCKLCKINFKTFDELVAHKNSRTHKKVRIQCPVCYRLLTAQLYEKHLVRHQSASHLVCDICGKLYRKDNLVRHLQLHSFELPFQCQICPYRGRFMESLKIHMKTHTGEKPFSCDKCELRFLTRSNLNRHLLTHKKERPFKCLECGRGFYTKRDLDVHFKADHVGLKEFGCQMCGNKYGTRKALMRHELRVHKRDKMAKGRKPLYLQAGYQK